MVSEASAKDALRRLIADYNNTSESTRQEMTEASVIRQFVDRLLGEVLGWPTTDPDRYKYEIQASGRKRPDITLFPERGDPIFVEAKKFGVIDELEQARYSTSAFVAPNQMTLPGMAVDRKPEEQQAINYAFENGSTWAILTNFEKVRLFNARRDWLVLSFEKPIALIDEFDMLWQLAYPNILDGSLDRLSDQRYRADVDKDYLGFINEWRERLAQDIVAYPARNPWAYAADNDKTINLPLLRSVVQGFLDRLVVVRFAEDHLVLPKGATLYNLKEAQQDNLYTFTMGEFLNRFFWHFDREHNSALFARGLVDEARFSDGVLRALVDKLYEARYRAMPADILGNTYEQYLGKALVLDNGSVTTRDNLETRKKQGSYYTPQVIVRHIVDHSLGRALYGTANGRPDGPALPDERRKTSDAIVGLRVLDSACGSGSFLIYAYKVLAEFYQSEIDRINAEIAQQIDTLAAAGKNPLDIRIEVAPLRAQIERIADYPRIILERHLYGVDLDPQAAEIAVVNLMMRAMERKRTTKRLPLILNQNVKVGNSLTGVRPDDARMAAHAEALAQIITLRAELVGTANTDPRHDVIVHELRKLTDAVRAALDADFAAHFSDLERVRLFHWGVEFPEVFYDADGTLREDAGFDVVIGNPPWEILKPDLREFYAQFDADVESKLKRGQVETRIEELNQEDPRREAQYNVQVQGIIESAAYFKQSADYTRQYRGDTATHKLFIERVYDLLSDGGRLGYVVPSGIYTDLGTMQLREMLLDEGHIQYIYSFSNERFFFPGVDHRFKFALLGAQKGTDADGFWAAFRFNPRMAVAPDELPEFLSDENNLVYVRRKSLEKFSPDSLSLMEFQTNQDYLIAEQIYGDNPLLGDEVTDAWRIKFTREFDMTNDRRLFNTRGEGLPLYEGKMINQFDPYFGEPQYWVTEQPASERLASKNDTGNDYRSSRVCIRAIARATDTRTLICTIIPPKSFCGNSILSVMEQDLSGDVKLFLSSVLNSYLLDSILRQKVAANVNMFYLYQLPVPRLTAGDRYFDAIVTRAARLTCTRPEFADLWADVTGDTWSESSGVADAGERQKLRDEIDGLAAHLYGLSRADYAHILGTFPLVFPATAAGRSRREGVLAAYDGVGV